MSDAPELVLVSLIGFGTTSSVLLGAAIGLYVPLSKRMLAALLACAAGALISALAIDLALGSAKELAASTFEALGSSSAGDSPSAPASTSRPPVFSKEAEPLSAIRAGSANMSRIASAKSCAN
jgi:hypothetical protein